MNTNAEQKRPGDRANLVSQDQLARVAELLPIESTVLGGVYSSEALTFEDAGTSLTIICANDDHTIHKVVIEERPPDPDGTAHYEIVSDTVVGTW